MKVELSIWMVLSVIATTTQARTPSQAPVHLDPAGSSRSEFSFTQAKVAEVRTLLPGESALIGTVTVRCAGLEHPACADNALAPARTLCESLIVGPRERCLRALSTATFVDPKALPACRLMTGHATRTNCIEAVVNRHYTDEEARLARDHYDAVVIATRFQSSGTVIRCLPL